MALHDPKDTAFVFVGGVSHTPIFFKSLVEEMASRGFEAHGFEYPTIGPGSKDKTQQDEYKAIQDVVARFAEGGKDVVLLGHSYGGWPASRAVKGWDKESRMKSGHERGIKEVVFLAAFLIAEDAPMNLYNQLPPWIAARGSMEDGERKPAEESIPLLFGDLSPEKQKYWYEQLEWQRNAFRGETIPDAPWHLKSLQKTIILTTNDVAMPLAIQLTWLKDFIDETWSVRSICSDHEPFLGRSKELADILLAPRY